MTPWFEAYHSYADIKLWFEKLYESNLEDGGTTMKIVKSIGKSAEGRDIFAVHITNNPVGGALSKKMVYLQCLIHGREWISGSVCQFITSNLVTKARSDLRIYNLLSRIEFVMIPIANPDGYSFTWTNNRLWRKNRRGPGVDLNRNFNDHWGAAGASNDPASNLYCGSSAASEPETQAIQNYLRRFKGRLIAAIDWHSFSQMILRSPGHATTPTKHDEYVRYASNAMARSMLVENNRQYKVLLSSELYKNSGSAIDWLYAQGVKYTVAVELPPSAEARNSMAGFVWSPRDIKSVCEEAWEGTLSFIDFANNCQL